MLGTLVVDERIFPIDRIELGRGRINFWFDHEGPLVLPERSEVRVHAPDGSLIATAPWHLPKHELRVLGRARRGDTAHICFPMAFASVVGWPAETAQPVAQGA